MADTTREILTLEDKATVRMRGKVKKVFDMANGKIKSGQRAGEDWHRQDFILVDQEGEVKVGWFNPGSTVTLSVMEGADVEVSGKINRYLNQNNEQVTAVSCSGAQAVKSLSGHPIATTPPPAQAQASPPATAHMASLPSDRDFLAWLREMAERVRLIEGIGPDPQAVQAACATAWIGIAKGQMQRTLGVGTPPAQKATQEESWSQPPDDDEVPF